ncbi:early transcription elongation factor of RNA pol II, NGN section-domain-containing protein [Entophlyctis helioformis]|nr:early transcription elongation factor of RNA pol II, NGN section-domain-containing protein [Entophlyctis helioformis]
MSDDVRRRRRADDDDDEDDDEEMDDLDDELDGRRSGGGGDRGRRSGRADDVDDDDEDDEEDEDEEDEDEDEGGGGGGRRPRKRARRRAANPFIDEEAAVDDDEDEDDDEEAEDGFEEAQVAETAFRDESRHRALDRSLQRSEEMNAEDIAERFKQRYGRSELARGGYRGDFDHVPQSVLIPSVNDPKLWLVRCKPGKERDIVTQLMRKFLDPAVAPLSIMSVFCRDSLQGYIYIEADKQAHVMAAIENVQNVYASKLALVPVNEMVDCLTIKAKDVEVKPHSWVRIKRGKYDGDLAQVLEVTESGEMATVKLIPRLEASKDSRTVAAPTMPGKRKKPEVRHPQRLFQPSDYQCVCLPALKVHVSACLCL